MVAGVGIFGWDNEPKQGMGQKRVSTSAVSGVFRIRISMVKRLTHWLDRASLRRVVGF